MPEVIKNYLETSSFSNTDKIIDTIIDTYKADFLKFADDIDIFKIRDVFNSVPVQLAKENFRFVFANVGTYGRNEKYEDAIL
jgi:hypothetical protein